MLNAADGTGSVKAEIAPVARVISEQNTVKDATAFQIVTGIFAVEEKVRTIYTASLTDIGTNAKVSATDADAAQAANASDTVGINFATTTATASDQWNGYNLATPNGDDVMTKLEPFLKYLIALIAAKKNCTSVDTFEEYYDNFSLPTMTHILENPARLGNTFIYDFVRRTSDPESSNVPGWAPYMMVMLISRTMVRHLQTETECSATLAEVALSGQRTLESHLMVTP